MEPLRRDESLPMRGGWAARAADYTAGFRRPQWGEDRPRRRGAGTGLFGVPAVQQRSLHGSGGRRRVLAREPAAGLGDRGRRGRVSLVEGDDLLPDPPGLVRLPFLNELLGPLELRPLQVRAAGGHLRSRQGSGAFGSQQHVVLLVVRERLPRRGSKRQVDLSGRIEVAELLEFPAPTVGRLVFAGRRRPNRALSVILLWAVSMLICCR